MKIDSLMHAYVLSIVGWPSASNTTNTHKKRGGGNETLSMAMACVEDTNDNGNGILANVEWDWIG